MSKTSSSFTEQVSHADALTAASSERSSDSGAAPASLKKSNGPSIFFPQARDHRRYWFVLFAAIAIATVSILGIVSWANPMPFGSDGFWRIAQLRWKAVAAIIIVSWCQGIATIAFQTVANNRIITPSIMGFEALYRLINTSAIFFLGVAGATALTGIWQYLFNVALMLAFSWLLFGWLVGSRGRHIHNTLLIGVVLGAGLGALSTYMQRLLTPSEFDVLTARLIGSMANADVSYLSAAVPLALAAGITLFFFSPTLDVMALGRDTAINLGVNYKRQAGTVLLLVALLIAVSTSLVGPLSFLGFLVAMLTYQMGATYSHRHLFPLSWAIGAAVLGSAYFTLRYVFYAEGAVGVIIEVVGGTTFLIYLLRKGRL
ncbi:MAG: iron chelate uptake ABC transporter family permease subunit [Actinomycetaceae bacterium]|nr:iron chelate uptake ABC transporter family permease subunit [Actinomycetaceae bacterium]